MKKILNKSIQMQTIIVAIIVLYFTYTVKNLGFILVDCLVARLQYIKKVEIAYNITLTL